MVARRQILVDLVGVGGLAALVWGAREVYEPAGWIVLGLGLLAFAVLASRTPGGEA